MPQLLGPNGGPVRLYGRSCTLDVGREDDNQVLLQNAIRIRGLRVAFKVIKSDKPEPNASEIQIYNLSEWHRSQLELRDTRCLLSAGYIGNESLIFSGDVTHAMSTKQGEDWVTKLELGDGAVKYSTARVNRFFGPGTSITEVAKSLAKELVSDPGNLLQRAQQLGETFSAGLTVRGSAAGELTRLLEPYGLRWSIQDGRLEVLEPTEFLPGTGPLISPDTGLIGSPTLSNAEKKKNQANRPVMVHCLLHPALRPGSGFRLESESIKGEFRCRKVEHTGDTYGQQWTTQIEALPRS